MKPQGGNLYVYVRDNSTNLTDPNGNLMAPCPDECSDPCFVAQNPELCPSCCSPADPADCNTTAASPGIGLATTTYKYFGVIAGTCTYKIFCSPRAHTCGGDTVTMKTPCTKTYLVLDFLVWWSGNTPSCFRVGPAYGTEQPAPCS